MILTHPLTLFTYHLILNHNKAMKTILLDALAVLEFSCLFFYEFVKEVVAKVVDGIHFIYPVLPNIPIHLLNFN